MFTFVTHFWLLITKTFLKLKKRKARRYATLFLETWGTILTKLYLIFKAIT